MITYDVMTPQESINYPYDVFAWMKEHNIKVKRNYCKQSHEASKPLPWFNEGKWEVVCDKCYGAGLYATNGAQRFVNDDLGYLTSSEEPENLGLPVENTLDSCTIVQEPTLGEPVAQDYEHVLEWRHPYKHTRPPKYWWSPPTGQVIGPYGKPGTIPKSTPLTTFLEKVKEKVTEKSEGKVHKATIYIVAGKTGKTRPKREWFNVYHEWTKVKLLWRALQAQYKHGDFEISLYGTCNWFGDETDLDAMYEAFNSMEQKLEKLFDAKGYTLMRDTPAQTGQELLLISLPGSKGGAHIQYPHLTGEVAEIVYHNLRYQGRVETFQPKRHALKAHRSG